VTPPHTHENDAESFFLMEGEITLHTKDGPTVVRPGQAGHIPAGVAHTLCVTSGGPARAVLVSAPTTSSSTSAPAAVRPSARRYPRSTAPADIGLLLREATAHGMTVLGPPGALPVDVVSEV
jgi:uncharacterized cupin superfamily protein